MKYTSFIALVTIAFFSSCSSCTKDRNGLPANPTNNQVYRDNNGNNWIYDALLMRWALSGTGGNTYYYYPSGGYYTNPAGTRITPPSSISSGITSTRSTSTSYSTSSNKSSVSKSTTTSKSSRGAVFGSTGKSHSISA